MLKLLINWYRRCFSDPNAAALMVVLIIIFLLVYFFHQLLFPILIAIVLSYLLEKPVNLLVHYGMPRVPGLLIVLCFAMALVLLVIAILVPLIWQQIIALITNLPTMLTSLNHYLSSLPEEYPELLNVRFFDSIIESIKIRAIENSNTLLQFSIASLMGVFSVIINLVLIPILIFFFLKDKDQIVHYSLRFLPRNRILMQKVAGEMNIQISNYIVGTFLQIVILTLLIYIPFRLFSLDYSVLLALIVGCSVIIPYIGLILATLPVILIALFQWGWTATFGYLSGLYFIILLLQCNIIVPVLFSETLDLHPLVIILAIIIFGGLWGFWGVFFSIPLATLIKAIINVWPCRENRIEKKEI